MNMTDELWSRLVQYQGKAPRDLVVEYVKAVIDDTREMSPQTLLGRESASGNMSIGEIVASKIITALAQQVWLDEDEALGEILSIAGQIDMNSSDRRLWQELFDEVDKL